MKLRNVRWMSCLLVIACGGGGSDDADDNAQTEGGETIRSGTGEAVNEDAHQYWTEGLAVYAEGVAQGWTPARCDSALSKFENANEEQDDAFAEALYMSGTVLDACGREGSRDFYQRALRIAEQSRQRAGAQHTAGNGPLCKARVALAIQDLQAGNRGGAQQAFQRAITEDAQCTSAYTNLAILQREGGGAQEEEALRNLRRALAIESDYMPAFNQMALLYYTRGLGAGGRASLDLAEIVCRQAQLINGNYAPIFNTWGLVKIAKGDVVEALRFFERAIELDASIFEAQMNFGSITLSFRGYQDAQRAFAKAVELRATSYEAHLGLGSALRGLEQFEAAKAEYERAQQIDGNRAEAYFNLGLLYQDYMGGSSMDETIGNLNRAKGFYEQFVAKAQGRADLRESVEAANRRCRYERDRRGRESVRPVGCRPGRIQNVERTVAALREGAQMQQEAERMQREAEAASGQAAQPQP